MPLRSPPLPDALNAMARSDVDQRPLVEFLLDNVTRGLSGQDKQDIVDFAPSRAIFAGVLRPVREHQASAAVASGGSAIGLDFRVRTEMSGEPIRLKLTGKWAHYYAVLPTWDQVVSTGHAERAVDDEGSRERAGGVPQSAPA